MTRLLLPLAGALAVAGGFLLGTSFTAPTPALEPTASTEPDQVVLWNEDHCRVTDLIGEWEVRSAPAGTRMRPEHDDCYIRILSAVDGLEHEFQVTTQGEVYIAHGWICVNQVDQESWLPTVVDDFFATTDCGGDPIECTMSYPKSDIGKVIIPEVSCWRSEAEPAAGCEWVKRCMAGSGDCHFDITLVYGGQESWEAACGSGGTLSQCKSAAGVTWLCYCE